MDGGQALPHEDSDLVGDLEQHSVQSIVPKMDCVKYHMALLDMCTVLYSIQTKSMYSMQLEHSRCSTLNKCHNKFACTVYFTYCNVVCVYCIL